MQTREEKLRSELAAATPQDSADDLAVLCWNACNRIAELEDALARERSHNPAHSVREAIERFDRANDKGPKGAASELTDWRRR